MLLGQGKKRSRRPQISVSMTDLAPIEAIRAELGGFLRSSKRYDRKLMHRWALNGNQALDALEHLLPYLVLARRRKLAELLLDRYPRQGYGHPKGGPHGAERRTAEIARLWQEMKRANAERRMLVHLEPVEPSLSDLAYTAGILDGEGWISANKPLVEVHSTDPELCAWLKSRFFGKCYVKRPRGGRRQLYVWRGTSVALQRMRGVELLMKVECKRERLTAKLVR